MPPTHTYSVLIGSCVESTAGCQSIEPREPSPGSDPDSDALTFSYRFPEIQQLDLLHEATKWKTLRHPNVERFLGLSFNVGNMPALVVPSYPALSLMESLSANLRLNGQKIPLVCRHTNRLFMFQSTNLCRSRELRLASNIYMDGTSLLSMVTFGR